jgi:hypothetical protein
MRNSFSKNKAGLSGIITVVIMIALVMAAAGIVWGVVNGTIKKQIESSEACFGNFDKVTLNRFYTCYDSGDNRAQFSITIGDIDVEEVIIYVASEGTTKSYTLTNTASSVSGLGPYPLGAGTVVLPGKNSGLTYIATGFNEVPNLIQIAPVISGQQCDVSDFVSEVGSC